MASDEYQILLAAGHLTPSAEHRKKLHNLLEQPFDGEHLVELAVKEGVAGLLYKNLVKAALLNHLDPAQQQRLESLYYLNLRNNLKLLHDLENILQRLAGSQTRVVLLQGMALLQQVYPDAGLRPLTDIDLWVLPADRAELAKALTGLGYKADRVYPDTFRKGSTIVDVNSHILWADRIRTRRLLLDLSQKDIYDNCRIIDCDGARCRCLNQYDQMLYLGLHALKHCAERLIWLADIRALIADWTPLDWAGLVKRAGAMGQQKAVACILFLLADLFSCRPPSGTRVPPGTTRLNRLEKRILKKRAQGHALPQWSPMLLLSGDKGLRRRMKFGFESLFPRPEILRQVFAGHPQLKDWQLYWKRTLQLLAAIK